MRSWWGTVAAAGLIETAGHLLSLAWGFTFLVAAFAVVASRLAVTSAKAANTEQRVAALVPQVGAIKDTATYASGRADSAYTNAGNAQTTANTANATANDAHANAATAQTAANNAQTTANNALPKSGGTITGDLHVNGWTYCGDLSGGGGAINFHDWIGGSITVDGTITANWDLHVTNALYAGAYRINPGVVTAGDAPEPPGAYSAPWEAGVSHRVNNLTAAFGR